MTQLLPPPVVDPRELDALLRRQGHAALDAAGFARLTGSTLAELGALVPSWNDLPPDNYLRDGGRYRRRRHACVVVDGDRTTPVPRRAHWQPLEYNALHGGLERWFEPIEPAVAGTPAWRAMLLAMAGVASALKGAQPWFVEAHQFRIDTADGIGRPTPEGAHRDGVDLVAVMLVERRGVKGGETRVFDAAGPAGIRFTLTEPWSALLIDDERVIHETTPIQPLAGSRGAHRDTLVLTLRRGGFQGP